MLDSELKRPMARNEVEAILFNLPRWQEMSLEEIPALVVRDIPLPEAEELYEGQQFVMGQSGLDAKQLFDFFKAIDNGKRLYYIDGYLKHPELPNQQPMVVGMDVNGLKLTEAELAQFSKLFGGSVEEIENDDQFFLASWGSPSWSKFLYEAI